MTKTNSVYITRTSCTAADYVLQTYKICTKVTEIPLHHLDELFNTTHSQNIYTKHTIHLVRILRSYSVIDKCSVLRADKGLISPVYVNL
jgi:hypothetical protein